MKFIFTFFCALFVMVVTSTHALPSFTPQLVLKNQQGETSVNYIAPSSTFIGAQIAANTIPANLTGVKAYPSAATYSQVSAKLLPSMLLTGFTAGGGVVVGTDTVIQGIQKLAGNVAAHQANSTAITVGDLVTDFNALLAKLQAAHLMQ